MLPSAVIDRLPMFRLPASHEVIIATNATEAEMAIKRLRSALDEEAQHRPNQQRVLGFDTESRTHFTAKPTKNSPVSLVQLSSHTITVLFRLLSPGLPTHLKAVLYDPSIIKVGQAVHGDVALLMKDHNFTYTDPIQHSFIDLQSWSTPWAFNAAGLRALTAGLLGSRLRQATTMQQLGVAYSITCPGALCSC